MRRIAPGSRHGQESADSAPTARCRRDEAVTAWTAKRKAMRQEFEGRQTAANNAFINAASAKIDGMGTLIGQKALDRVIAEGKAKTERQAALAKLDTTD